jgi:heme oxygenase
LRDRHQGYGEFLQRIAAVLVPLERELAEAKVVHILPDWNERTRSSSICADILDMSLSFVERPFDQKTEAQLRDEAFQFGVLYVLEGSRLGARVM